MERVKGIESSPLLARVGALRQAISLGSAALKRRYLKRYLVSIR
jgi:hypothetical protein